MIAAVMVALMGITVGVALYLDRVAPFQQTVIVVNDTSVTMRYFLKRTLLSGQAPMSMLPILASEEIIKQVAPYPPYNIHIKEADMDQALREGARGERETISESEFNAWYRQQRNESRLSDAEFRDVLRTSLLRRRLHAYLAERIPTVAAQVHLHMIAQASPGEAAQARARLEAGEDFATLAREVSSDAQVKETGGDFGWFPRGALSTVVAEVAFDQLGVGEVSQPLVLDQQRVIIVMVSEKAAAREIEADSLQKLKTRALDTWLEKEFRHHIVAYHGFNNGYDAETDAWVKWQLHKMRGNSGRES